MDTKGIISEHSKIKLELYKLYLERYLAVLLVTPFFESIHVHDIFAGSGVSKNDEKGSALLAAEVIKNIATNHNQYGKTILLSLNDANKTNFQQLQDYLKAYSFASVTNHAADQYIKSWSPVAGSHNLFFIDPHGYSQVSIQNLKRLFSGDNRDFLISSVATPKAAICGHSKPAISNDARTRVFTPLLADEASMFWFA